MAKPPRFDIRQTIDGKWTFNIPAALSGDGKRKMPRFDTRRQAEEARKHWKKQAEDFGKQSRVIGPSLAEMAVQAEALLKPYNVNILEITRAYIKQQEKLKSSETVSNAITKYYLAHPHWSKSYQNNQKQRNRKLVDAFGDRLLASISHKEIIEHLEETASASPQTWNHAVRIFKSFWNWAAGPQRRWCNKELLEEIESKRVEKKEIKFLNAQEVRKLFAVTEKHFPEAVPVIALGIFAGIRPEEIIALKPSDITDEGINVPHTHAKTNSRRYINMRNELLIWLKAYPIGDKIQPDGWERKQKAIKRLAGWKVWSDLAPRINTNLTDKPDDDLPEWPHDAIRHTNATILVATGKKMTDLIFEFGHRQNSDLLKSNYVGAMSKKEAIEILSIGPKGTTIKYNGND